MKTNITKTNKTQTQTPSVVSTPPPPAPVPPGGFTLGLDLGDRSHQVCVLDAAGQIVREGALPNTRPALAKLLAEFPRATVAMEAGTHSPWISRYLTELGAKVLVANPRKLHAISRNERKCDRRDARMPARGTRALPHSRFGIRAECHRQSQIAYRKSARQSILLLCGF